MILRKKTKRGKRLKAPQKRKISLKSVFVRHFGAPLNTFLPLRVLLKKYPLPSLTPPPPILLASLSLPNSSLQPHIFRLHYLPREYFGERILKIDILITAFTSIN